jgi:hypothetical protein
MAFTDYLAVLDSDLYDYCGSSKAILARIAHLIVAPPKEDQTTGMAAMDFLVLSKERMTQVWIYTNVHASSVSEWKGKVNSKWYPTQTSYTCRFSGTKRFVVSWRIVHR